AGDDHDARPPVGERIPSRHGEDRDRHRPSRPERRLPAGPRALRSGARDRPRRGGALARGNDRDAGVGAARQPRNPGHSRRRGDPGLLRLAHVDPQRVRRNPPQERRWRVGRDRPQPPERRHSRGGERHARAPSGAERTVRDAHRGRVERPRDARAGGAFRQTGGTTTLEPPTSRLVAAGGTVDVQAGTLAGPGVVEGSLHNAGTVSPGPAFPLPEPARAMKVTGDYTQAPGGTLDVTISSQDPDTGHVRLDVGGNAMFAGTLKLETL